MLFQTSFLDFNKENLQEFALHGWVIVDHAFPYSLSELLLKEIEADFETEFRPALIGQGSAKTQIEEVRKDWIRWVDPARPTLAQSMFLEEMERVRQTLNREFFLALKGFETHAAVYAEGAFYQRHKDQFHQDDARKISAVLYLNPLWQSEWGGDLVLYPQVDGQEEAIRIKPLFNRVVLFRSFMEHEVLTTQAPRYSFTGWFKDRIS